jgi:hypothetical protein
MMPRIPYLRLAAALLAIAASREPSQAMDWPISPPRLAATFGTYAKGRVIAGVGLSAADVPVRSAEEGEVSFSLDEGASPGILPGRMPAPLGSFLVIEHQRGLAAVYSHLDPGSLGKNQRKLGAGDIIGRTGASGWIEGSGAIFQVFDRRASSWVNPLLVLPPLADDKPPVIRSLALSRAGKAYVLGEVASVPQGTYWISVDVADPADSAWTAGPLAPFRIRLSVDGIEAAEEVFDVAKGVGGELMLFALSPRASSGLRTKEGRYSLAERLFSRGRAALEVGVEDAAGNKRSASWTLVVE